MKVKPIKGKWVLFYDENKYILKECFIVEQTDVLYSEELSKKLPKNRIYSLSSFQEFKELKNNLGYKLEDQFPDDIQLSNK